MKELSEHLSAYYYSLFGTCMLVFTHFDKHGGEVNRNLVEQQGFKEILSLVDNSIMFLNCTDRSQVNRDRVLSELVRLYTSGMNEAIYQLMNLARMNLLINCPNNIFGQKFFSLLCHRVSEENNNRQFIGGKSINQRVIRDIATRRQEMTLKNQIFKFSRRHHRKLIIAMILVSTPVIYRIVYASVRDISKMLYSPIRQVFY